MSIKRVSDIILSFMMLAMISPLFVIVAILIKFNDRGPVFFRGVRIGKGGKPFKMFKFRSMVVNAETIGCSSTPDDDFRLTKTGKLLKKYQLDELPQLINVLNGEMSLVGPRPQVPWAVKLYNPEEKQILNLLPGMTDWASLWNFHEGEILKESKDPDKDYMEKIHPQKMKLSLKYVKNHSLGTDFEIILETIKRIFLEIKR